MIASTTAKLSWPIRLIHWVIILNLVIQSAYGTYMIFFVVNNGHSGPLGSAAASIPFELMVTRRLYASETWIAMVGLSLYIGLTEILPRVLKSER